MEPDFPDGVIAGTGKQGYHRCGTCKVNHLAKPLEGRTVVRQPGDIGL